jgi:hypothetical protein
MLDGMGHGQTTFWAALVLLAPVAGCAAPPAPLPADTQAAPEQAVGPAPEPADARARRETGPDAGPIGPPSVPEAGDPDAPVLEERVAPPPGFARVPLESGGFGAWLRRAPLLPRGTPVLLHTGEPKPNQRIHAAVLDFDVGRRDLQQCADAVMRLRAEYLWSAGRSGEICFRSVRGEKLRWRGGGRAAFRRYLDSVFAVANSASLLGELEPVSAAASIEPGDVRIVPAAGGYYGHAVIAMDVAADERGRRIFLLAQSYMPAQSIHLLVNRREPGLDPWYSDARDAELVTPEWTFAPGSLRRFRDGACAR